MTVKLSQLREPPLLGAIPVTGESSSYEEVKDEYLPGMRKALHNSMRVPNRRCFTTMALGMKKLGLNVEREITTMEDDCWSQLLVDIANYGDISHITWLASDMKQLDLDLRKKTGMIRARALKVMKQDYSQKDWYSYAQMASELKTLGVGVPAGLKATEAELRTELDKSAGNGWWMIYARHAVFMKRIGFDAAADMRAMQGALFSQLGQCAAGKDWDGFAGLASDLSEFGLLTPRKSRHQPALPQLKRFGT
jgi:hypothetical protein